MADHLTELKKLLDTDKIILGTSRTLKAIKRGEIAKVFTSVNAPNSVKEDLNYYSCISGFDIVSLEIPNDELGTICRKQFAVSVISVRK